MLVPQEAETDQQQRGASVSEDIQQSIQTGHRWSFQLHENAYLKP